MHVRETAPQLEEAYVETGQVRYIFRPIFFDARTLTAAEALYCAGEQGKFWEMHDWLFAYVEAWYYAKDAWFLVEQSSADVGLDAAALEQCLREGRYGDQVKGFIQDAVERGITGTPTFLINDRLLVGAYPFDMFRQVIEEEMAQ